MVIKGSMEVLSDRFDDKNSSYGFTLVARIKLRRVQLQVLVKVLRMFLVWRLVDNTGLLLLKSLK